MFSRITGLVREIVMARLFGASMVYDTFLLGFRIPNLTRDLFAEGALSSAFIPTFTDYLANKSKKEAAHLANLVANRLGYLAGSVMPTEQDFEEPLEMVGMDVTGLEKLCFRTQLRIDEVGERFS